MVNSLKGKTLLQRCTDLLWHLKSAHVGSRGFENSHLPEQSLQILSSKLCSNKLSRWLLYWRATAFFGNFLRQLQSGFQKLWDFSFAAMLVQNYACKKKKQQTNNAEKLNLRTFKQEKYK